MGVASYTDLASHVGHEIQCVLYGTNWNVALECLDCGEVLVDFDKDTCEWRYDKLAGRLAIYKHADPCTCASYSHVSRDT